MQFWLWLLSGAGAQRARDWKPVRLRDLTLKAVLGEVGGFMLCLVALPISPLLILVHGFRWRTPIKMADWEWMAFSLSWGAFGAFGAYWLFG